MSNSAGRRTRAGDQHGEAVGAKRKSRVVWRQPSIVRALFERQATGRRGALRAAGGRRLGQTDRRRASLQPFARRTYRMSDAIPRHMRHDRVILGFTADGEHVILCCGPVAKPSRLEFRRVRLQWRGLFDPQEPPWILPLHVRERGRRSLGANASDRSGGLDSGMVAGPSWQPEYDEELGGGSASDASGESDSEREEYDREAGVLAGLPMAVQGDREPASIAVTESSDGYVVVAVVALRFGAATPIVREEERVYRVFVAPGPAFLAYARAPGTPEFPFVASAFSYIVNTTGLAPFSSLAAHDIAVMGDGRLFRSCERAYAIVLNAVDTINILQVTLRTSWEASPVGSPTPATPTTSGAKFVVRPEGNEPSGDGSFEANGGTRRGKSGRRGLECSGTHGAGCAWWAVGEDLPSTALISVRQLPCRPPITNIWPSVASQVALSRRARVSSRGAMSGNRGGSSSSSSSSFPRGASSLVGVDAWGVADAGCDVSTRRARACVDRSRQRMFDLEAFISELLRRPEALPRRGGDGRKSAGAGAEVCKEDASSSVRDGEEEDPSPLVHATDYQSATVGFIQGGYKVLLCLVVKVTYRCCSRKSIGRIRGDPMQGCCTCEGVAKEPEFLGYVLALNLRDGEVAVLETRSWRGAGMKCASQCESLVRYVRRTGRYSMARSGRRVSNTALLHGQSLEAITNPIFPLAIVRR